MLKKSLFSFLLFSSSLAFAASLKSGCYLQDGEGQELQGVNVDRKYEIASVSKIMTSFWSIKKMGYQGRFETNILIHKVGEGLYDLHFVGAHDPYAGREMLQFTVAQLNKMGIRNVRNLTFDENFKFLAAPRGAAQGHFGLTDPSNARVMQELRAVIGTLKSGYDSLVSRAKSMGTQLPAGISFQVADIRVQEKADVDPKGFETSFKYRSSELHAILKEMNFNSNNHAANQIFESLGGAEAFRTFIKKELGLDENSIQFFNGSGDRHDFPGGASVYNQATCRTVVQVVTALRDELKKTGHGLQDVMALAGSDFDDASTVTRIYSSPETSKALVAKTGTVNPSVALAGMINTQEGRVYFGYIMGTDASAGDWRSGRQKIREQVVKLFNRFGGKSVIAYQPERFLPFATGRASEESDMNLALK